MPITAPGSTNDFDEGMNPASAEQVDGGVDPLSANREVRTETIQDTKDQIASLKEELETVRQMSEQKVLYKRTMRLMDSVLARAEEARDAGNATLEQEAADVVLSAFDIYLKHRELGRVISDHNTASKEKREARKGRFKMIMPGGEYDEALKSLFAVSRKLDEAEKGGYQLDKAPEIL